MIVILPINRKIKKNLLIILTYIHFIEIVSKQQVEKQIVDNNNCVSMF